MVETMGSGGGFLDYDGDGHLDIYLVQAGPLPGFDDLTPLPNRLLRNRGDGTFEDVTEMTGSGELGYGMGACFGDVDNDGAVDIYVTNFGPDRLLHNEGGRFRDVTAASGIDNPRWGASCAFADFDRDGCLDLYVANYVGFTFENHRRCGPEGLAMYCHPDVYDGEADRLYRGRCDGTFDDVTGPAGVRVDDPRESKGLGVIWIDADDDGWPDIYVANDSTRNFLYRNNGDGTFTDIAVRSGTAYNELGFTEAGMGIAAGDTDGDGNIDLFVTHLDFETNTLYRNQGDADFLDATTVAGLAGPGVTRVGFGVNLFDMDADGDLDLFVANGHILDNIGERNGTLTHAQSDQLFENVDGRFVEITRLTAPDLTVPTVSRGSATGDVDGDGDLDLLVTRNNGAAALFRNDSPPGHWIRLRLVSRYGGRDAVGTRVRLYSGDRVQVRELRSGGSYLSQSDPGLHFGLGGGAVDRLEVRWPDGTLQSIPGDRLRLNDETSFVQPAAGDPS